MQDDVNNSESDEWIVETQERLFNTLAQLHRNSELSVEQVNTLSRLADISLLREFSKLKSEQALPWVLGLVNAGTNNPPSTEFSPGTPPPISPSPLRLCPSALESSKEKEDGSVSSVSSPIPISASLSSCRSSSLDSCSPHSSPFSTVSSSSTTSPTKANNNVSLSSSKGFSFRNLLVFTATSPLATTVEEDESKGVASKTPQKVTMHMPEPPETKQMCAEDLIKLLLSPDLEQVDFRSVYMLSFRSFTSPSELLSRLFYYYDNPQDVSQDGFHESLSLTVRLKVISLLNYWLKTYFADFTPELRTTLHACLDQRMKAEPESKSLLTLHHVLQRLEAARCDSVEGDDKSEELTGNLRPRSGPSGTGSTSYISSISIKNSKSNRRSRTLDILDVAPNDMARELTLLDFELFKSIAPLELADQAWKRHPEKSFNVVAFIQAFNDRAQWVASELLARTKINERTAMKERFIDIAFECLKLDNFHTMFAIMAALTQHAVHRLKDLQGALDAPHERIAEQLRAITSSRDNYRMYRTLFQKAFQSNRTCLPHLGVTLKNLTLFQTPSPYEQQNKVIDINRLVLIASEISRVEECTQRQYQLPQDPELRRKVRRALEKFAGKTDDELIARSLALEPKMTWQQYNQKVCLDVLQEEGFL